MLLSVSLLPQYYAELSAACLSGTDTAGLRLIGIGAEKRMLRTCGSNAHKGYIFLSGLVLLALLSGGNIPAGVRKLSSGFFRDNLPESNGENIRRIHRTGGIVGECLNGLPSVFHGALPAMKTEYARSGCRERMLFAGLAALMQTAEDTTALHRCGTEGLRILKEDGVTLEKLLYEDAHIEWLNRRNHCYVSMNLTMGGAADLLALSYAVLMLEGFISESE
jgi:triphosphoribosyl-dephospho-CoA synthase